MDTRRSATTLLFSPSTKDDLPCDCVREKQLGDVAHGLGVPADKQEIQLLVVESEQLATSVEPFWTDTTCHEADVAVVAVASDLDGMRRPRSLD